MAEVTVPGKRFSQIHRRAQRAESNAEYWYNEARKAREEADSLYYHHQNLSKRYQKLSAMRPMWTRWDGLRLFLFGRV